MTAPETRWTAETEELVARRICAVDRQRVAEVDDVWRAYREQARSALAELAFAGLLAQHDGALHEEWGTRHRDIATGTWVITPGRSESEARLVHEDLAQVWGHHARLIRRTVHVGPWIEVPS